MKRLTSLVLVFLLAFSLTACAGQPAEKTTAATEAKTTAAKTEAPTTEAATTEAATEVATTAAADNAMKTQYPFTITNEIEGETVEVTFEKAPERAASLASFTTEIMLALGLEDKMVGYAYQDNEVLPQYKDALAKIKMLSETFPSQEVLLEVEPDFLTGWTGIHNKYSGVDFLEKQGIKYYVPRTEYPNTTMEVVYNEFELLGKIFDVNQKAAEIIKDMKARIAAVHEKVKDEAPLKVFFYDSGTEDDAFTASAGLPTELTRLAGGENIFAGTEKNWFSVSWEQIVEKNPDAIIIIDYIDSDPVDKKIELIKNHPALKNTNAVLNEKFMVIGLTDILAGERNVKAVEDMAKFLHPEAFK